ncbi:PorT family protein [Cellulophaga baltica]|uniref:PorT family protein n=1 Tax=Cellulophaga baltica TaxID=76594 RepID=UPI002147DD8B|nr:PorT family protein [Cellulophaga baltica]MCR1023210.1 PorT family protein [Cellulophaga baltica]
MSKKNLDELFREQFRDFDEVPDDKVWTAIEASLDQKKSRKLIPVWWWKLGGIAAASLLLLYVINPFSNEIDSVPVVDIEQPVEEHSKELIEKTGESPVVETSGTTNQEVFDTEAVKENNSSVVPSYVAGDETRTKVKKATRAGNYAPNATRSYAEASTKRAENLQQENNRGAGGKASNLGSVAKNTSSGTTQNAVGIANNTKNQNNSHLREKHTDANVHESRGDVAAITPSVEKEANNPKGKKKSIFDEIEDEEVLVAEHKANKWSVSPSIAPVYFNGLGEGSPIHSAFISNSKTGNVNLSYGVAVAYEVTKRLKVRSGIHKVDYGYNTNQIEFSSSVNGAATVQIANIDYKTTSKNIVVQSELNLDSKAGFVASDVTAKSPSLNGDLSQQFGYLEVPLELNYALLDKRFGINVIGGVSSLFLLNNDVFLNSGDQTTEVGEANNINDINFSTNFGFGFNYKLTQKLLFNLEPVFKYQLNTFSNTAGDFQPFSVGVYSGVSFRF